MTFNHNFPLRYAILNKYIMEDQKICLRNVYAYTGHRYYEEQVKCL